MNQNILHVSLDVDDTQYQCMLDDIRYVNWITRAFNHDLRSIKETLD